MPGLSYYNYLLIQALTVMNELVKTASVLDYSVCKINLKKRQEIQVIGEECR